MSGNTVVRTIAFAYNADNAVTSASDPSSSYAFTYDNRWKQKSVEGLGRSRQDGAYSRNHGGRLRGGKSRRGFVTTPRPRPFGGGAPPPRGGGVGKAGGVGVAVGGLGVLYDYFSGAADFWNAVTDNFDPFAPTTLGNSDIQPPPEPLDDTST